MPGQAVWHNSAMLLDARTEFGQKQAQSIKPSWVGGTDLCGICGIVLNEQVSSGNSRNPAGHCKRLEFDLYYIEHASIMLDIYILLKTPGVLLRRRGAR